jgi:NADH/NAD ratio-sensing transcriptional regulator Rex
LAPTGGFFHGQKVTSSAAKLGIKQFKIHVSHEDFTITSLLGSQNLGYPVELLTGKFDEENMSENIFMKTAD